MDFSGIINKLPPLNQKKSAEGVMEQPSTPKAEEVNLKGLSELRRISSLKNSEGNQAVEIDITTKFDLLTGDLERLLSDSYKKSLTDFTKSLDINNQKLVHDVLYDYNNGSLSITNSIEELTKRGIKVDGLKELIAQASTLGAISSKEIQMILGDSIAKLSIENQKTYKMFEDQYKSGNISLSSYIEESSKVFSKQGVKDGKVDSALEGLNDSLSLIEKHTDPDTNKLTNAEKIQNLRRRDIERNADRNRLSTIRSLANKQSDLKVRKDLLNGASDVESATANATQGILEDILDTDGTRKSKRAIKGRSVPKTKMGKALGAASKFGTGILAAGSGLLSSAAKMAGPLAGVASAGLAAWDYSNATDSSQRKESVGSGVGGIVGGALGALGGPLGAMAGAAAGSWVGGKVGKWFTNPQDYIPDEVKKAGVIEELRFIDQGMIPQIQSAIASGSTEYSKSDLESLQLYKNKLMTKDLKDYYDRVAPKGTPESKYAEVKKALEPLSSNAPALYSEILLNAKKTLGAKDEEPKKVEEIKPSSLSNASSSGAVAAMESSSIPMDSATKSNPIEKQAVNQPTSSQVEAKTQESQGILGAASSFLSNFTLPGLAMKAANAAMDLIPDSVKETVSNATSTVTTAVSNAGTAIASGASKAYNTAKSFIMGDGLRKADSGVNLDGVNPSVLNNLQGMALDYKNETGKDITVTSGYRSVQKQAELYAKDPTKAAKPGSSLHNFGYAIDVNSSDANKLSTLGLLDKWGFSRPLMGMGEPWHIEPKGLDKSAIRKGAEPLMAQYGPTTPDVSTNEVSKVQTEGSSLNDGSPSPMASMANSMKPENVSSPSNPGGSTPEGADKVKFYTDQGMTNPVDIAAATGVPINDVKSVMKGTNSTDTYASTYTETKAVKSNAVKDENPQTPQSQVVVVGGGSSGGSSYDGDKFRIADQGTTLLAHM